MAMKINKFFACIALLPLFAACGQSDMVRVRGEDGEIVEMPREWLDPEKNPMKGMFDGIDFSDGVSDEEQKLMDERAQKVAEEMAEQMNK
jgi:hypothetical protein